MMSEREAHEWLRNFDACLKADESLPRNVASHFNDLRLFLVEFCCPNKTAAARAALIRAAQIEAAELGLDDPIPGVRCIDCE